MGIRLCQHDHFGIVPWDSAWWHVHKGGASLMAGFRISSDARAPHRIPQSRPFKGHIEQGEQRTARKWLKRPRTTRTCGRHVKSCSEDLELTWIGWKSLGHSTRTMHKICRGQLCLGDIHGHPPAFFVPGDVLFLRLR